METISRLAKDIETRPPGSINRANIEPVSTAELAGVFARGQSERYSEDKDQNMQRSLLHSDATFRAYLLIHPARCLSRTIVEHKREVN